MKAGQLDQRVTLEQLVEGQDEAGQPFTDWVPVFDAWAAVKPLTGREFIAAQAAVREITARVKMRYRPGVTAADRIVHDGTTYSVTSVADVHSSRRELHLMCKAVG